MQRPAYFIWRRPCLHPHSSCPVHFKVHGDDEIGTLKLTMYGSDADILVMSPAEYELARHMKEPTPVDLGDFVLSPMPGTLISFAVKVSVHDNSLPQFIVNLITCNTSWLVMPRSLSSTKTGGRRRRAGPGAMRRGSDEDAERHPVAEGRRHGGKIARGGGGIAPGGRGPAGV